MFVVDEDVVVVFVGYVLFFVKCCIDFVGGCLGGFFLCWVNGWVSGKLLGFLLGWWKW